MLRKGKATINKIYFTMFSKYNKTLDTCPSFAPERATNNASCTVESLTSTFLFACSSTDAVDTPPTGRGSASLFSDAGMFYGSPP